jgi:hypothetical protein
MIEGACSNARQYALLCSVCGSLLTGRFEIIRTIQSQLLKTPHDEAIVINHNTPDTN